VKHIQKAVTSKTGAWAVGRYFKCAGCGKTLEVEADDTVFTYKEFGKAKVNFIPCPFCDTSVEISMGLVVDEFGHTRGEAGIRG
jgi:hypothetical protein